MTVSHYNNAIIMTNQTGRVKTLLVKVLITQQSNIVQNRTV